ncbi:MAG: hypothetical protein IMZ66_05165, partial [Planctomycetes bacterium]|nr:hypothetical protein [Planctomycetota bacterium]
MRPETAAITLRRDLMIVANEFDAEAAGKKFIASLAAPVAPVPEAAATYPVINKECFKRPATSTRRTEGGAYNRIQGTFATASYECEENGLEDILDDRRAKRFASWLDFEREATRLLRYQMLMAWEKRVKAAYVALGLTNTNVGTAWTTVATATPLGDIQTGVETLEDKCGCIGEDLSLIIPRADFREFLAVTQVVDKSKYTYPGVQPANLAADQIAKMLGIKQVLLARGSYDGSEEGITAESATQIWTAGVMYLALLADPGSGLDRPSAMRTIRWTGDGVAADGPIVER